MYPEDVCSPMREELTSAGFQELRTVEQVDEMLNKKEGTVLVLVNSICGCAAGSCRPGALLSLDNSKKPDVLTTVFAGQDKEATERARAYMIPYPPSSPSIALFKNGELVHFVERHHIEGHLKEAIAENLTAAYDEFC